MYASTKYRDYVLNGLYMYELYTVDMARVVEAWNFEQLMVDVAGVGDWAGD